MLELSGSLRVAVDGNEIEITANGKNVVVDIGRSHLLVKNARFVRRIAPLVRVLARRLYADELTVTLTYRGKTLARAGFGARDSFLGSLLRVRHLVVFPKAENS